MENEMEAEVYRGLSRLGSLREEVITNATLKSI